MQKQHLYNGPNHAANLNSMRLKDKWCDVTIKVNGREIRAHKVILAANLEYFETMFSNDSFQESKDGVITMEFLEEKDVEAFVCYAYTGEILLTETNALNLVEVANYLSEDGIKEACIEFLEKHLKAEEAFRAYNTSRIVDSSALRSIAKTTIIRNFGNCSKNADYLDFDYESLVDVLSGGKAQPAESQQIFFKGIIRWIMHDAKERKIYLRELLSSIDIIKLTADDVAIYLYEIMMNCDNDYGITKDVIVYCQTSKIEQKKQGHALMVVGPNGSELSLQFYYLIENKWSPVQEISGTSGDACPYSAVLNNRLYYISYQSGKNHLRVYNPMTNQSITLDFSTSILGYAALCACSRFLYLCGGVTNGYGSNQVLRYDPQTNSLETLTPMGTGRYAAAAIFHQGYLHVLGGYNQSQINLVEKYDSDTREWTSVGSMCKSRYHCQVAVLGGKLYACGDDITVNSRTVEVYDPATNTWRLVASMNKNRLTFLAVAHEGKLLVIGGDEEKTVEVYDPSKDQWQIDGDLSSGLQIKIPLGGLISASCIADVK